MSDNDDDNSGNEDKNSDDYSDNKSIDDYENNLEDWIYFINFILLYYISQKYLSQFSWSR